MRISSRRAGSGPEPSFDPICRTAESHIFQPPSGDVEGPQGKSGFTGVIGLVKRDRHILNSGARSSAHPSAASHPFRDSSSLCVSSTSASAFLSISLVLCIVTVWLHLTSVWTIPLL